MIKLLTIVALFAICVAAKKKSVQLRRITNGKPAHEDQFPWQAAIFFIKNEIGNVCGGALISPQFIFTAAHCVYNASGFQVFLAATKLKHFEPNRIRVTVESVIAHELYNPKVFFNDVGVIKLSAPVECSAHIMPIRLPARYDFMAGNQDVFASGWGMQHENGKPVDDLHYVRLITITNRECVTGAKCFNNVTEVVDHVLCCDGSQLRQICQGDSGGALFKYARDGKATHVGVTSFAKGCGLGYPSAYMRTASFVDWIETNTGISFAHSHFCE